MENEAKSDEQIEPIQNPVSVESFYLQEDAFEYVKLLKSQGVYCEIYNEGGRTIEVYIGQMNAPTIHLIVDESNMKWALEIIAENASEMDTEETGKEETMALEMAEESPSEREDVLYPKSGTKASLSLLMVGYLTAFLGGFLSIIIAFRLMNLTNEYAGGERRFYYDAATRMHGKIILILGIIIFSLGLFFYFTEFRNN